MGSAEAVECICGLRPKSFFVWRRPSLHRDAGDIPSARHMRQLLAHAEARDIPLTAEHLIRGCSADELEALIARAAARPDADPQARVAAE